MNQVMVPCFTKSVLVFIDDILVYKPDMKTHLQHLKEVLQLLLHHQLYIKQRKLMFICSHQLEYLGHVIGPDVVSTDTSKVEVVKKMAIAYKHQNPQGILRYHTIL
jgi:hypothetical protein